MILTFKIIINHRVIWTRGPRIETPVYVYRCAAIGRLFFTQKATGPSRSPAAIGTFDHWR